uniref:Uncharacterized protein n=1 Tax=Rhodnius prolixus TaxID=13249 RepID=T1HXP3_RHOPR
MITIISIFGVTILKNPGHSPQASARHPPAFGLHSVPPKTHCGGVILEMVQPPQARSSSPVSITGSTIDEELFKQSVLHKQSTTIKGKPTMIINSGGLTSLVLH